jgi:CHC2 zinc finger/DNA polymerase III gamma and tau subunits C terminal/TIR domain
MASKPPDAFLSYTRFDDQHDRGAISQLRLRLASAVRAVTGEPFDIFQDVDGLGLGERWRDKLEEILDQARFLIPILTPSYFSSKACREELEKFLDAEKKRRRSDLVLPIYYIQCPVLEEADLCEADHLARIIHERQRWDWRDLRLRSFRNRSVQLAIEALAREIYKVRRRVRLISLQEFKARLPIAEIVSRYVRLVRRGRDLWGCCPFRKEKGASFHVAPEKGFYHCFGCGQHGNAIDFVMAIEALNFNQAVARLADLTGLPVPRGASAAPNVSSTIEDGPQKSLPQSFEEVVEMFDRRGEPMLHGWLYQTAQLVHFEPGRIELRLAPGTPSDLPGRVAVALDRWTGRPWLVMLAADSGAAEPTLAEQARNRRR